MSDSTSQIKTGLFVLIGGVAFAISILFFGGDRAFLKSYSRYKIVFSSTQGLTKGSVISMAGVQVGHVEKIDFTDNHKLVATITVDEKFAHLLGENSMASVKTQGALGDKYIYVTTRQSEESVLPPNSYIRASESGDIIDVISNKISDLSEVTETIKEFHLLLQGLNANGKSALITENILKATQSVTTLTTDPSIASSMQSLHRILSKIEKGEGTLGRLVNDPTVYNQLVQLLGENPQNKYLKPLLRETIKKSEQGR
jgi:phospholipid/cholesterol/gamma-HCH transport system substrate-binding protein